MAYKFVDFNDPSIPIGKRKQAYVRYAVSHGTPLEVAKFLCGRKFKARPTGQVAPPMHYYIVEWDGRLQLRNCSERIMSDEEVIMLLHKHEWYALEELARQDGNPLNTRDDFLKCYNRHRDELASLNI